MNIQKELTKIIASDEAIILIILTISILTSMILIYRAVIIPDYIKINHAEAQRCFEDMQQNKNIICD